MPRVVMLGVLETVAYLARSGRVPQVASRAAELLGLRPVVRFARGEGSLVHVAPGPAAGLCVLQRSLMQAGRDQGMGIEGEGLEASAWGRCSPTCGRNCLGPGWPPPSSRLPWACTPAPAWSAWGRRSAPGGLEPETRTTAELNVPS